jgi:hypothetical protein
MASQDRIPPLTTQTSSLAPTRPALVPAPFMEVPTHVPLSRSTPQTAAAVTAERSHRPSPDHRHPRAAVQSAPAPSWPARPACRPRALWATDSPTTTAQLCTARLSVPTRRRGATLTLSALPRYVVPAEPYKPDLPPPVDDHKMSVGNCPELIRSDLPPISGAMSRAGRHWRCEPYQQAGH